jgi:hypothetical protein
MWAINLCCSAVLYGFGLTGHNFFKLMGDNELRGRGHL